MKKIFTTLVAVFAITQFSYAQWNYSTIDVNDIYNLNSGKVGIGTATPSVKLDVQSSTYTANFQNNAASNSPIVSMYQINAGGNDAAQGLYLDVRGNGSGLDVYNAGTSLFRVKTNGYVGIGNVSPGFKLDVSGVIHSSISSGSNLVLSKPTGSSIEFNNGSGIPNALIEADASSNRLEFWTYNVGSSSLTERMTINNAGNVGIGTTGPGAPLEVNGSTTSDPTLIIRNSSYNSGNSTGTAAIAFGYANHTGPKIEASKTANNITDLNFYGEYGYNNSQKIMTLAANINGGSVGIGTSDTKGYKLAVNGNVVATAMTVKLYSAWPDYVFKPTYVLPSLTEVKTYIDKYQHLPGMPAAAEVAKEGLNLGELNKLLTKKVEELTLYLIKQDKEITRQNTKAAIQQNQIDELKQQVEAITKALNKN